MKNDDMLPHPKILATLEDMKAKGMLRPEAREAARRALARMYPDKVQEEEPDMNKEANEVLLALGMKPEEVIEK